MQSESINSIELAVAAATFVLGIRLFSLIQATRGVPDAHREVLDAVAGGDFDAVESRARGIRYSNPYGDAAAELIDASQREGVTEKRKEHLGRAASIAGKRIIRSTGQGQGMDIAALAVATGIVVFSRETLPTGPLFWSMIGAMGILLLSSVVARAALRASLLGSIEALARALAARPEMPSFSDGPIACLWCAGKTERGHFRIRKNAAKTDEQVDGTLCKECGKFFATLDVEGSLPPQSGDD